MAVEVKEKQTIVKPHSRSNEIIGVVVLALAILVFLCLVTYSPNDWSLNTSSEQKTQNWIGVVGSVIADLLFQAIGLSAYFLPAMMILIAWRFLRAKDFFVSLSRIVGAEAFFLRGMINLRRGNLDESVAQLRTALFWDNRLINAHVALGKIYLQRGDCLQAKNYAASAIAIDAENQDAIGLGRQIERCGK